MNDAQIWATIIGGVSLAWHAINVWARLKVVRSTYEIAADAAKNGVNTKVTTP